MHAFQDIFPGPKWFSRSWKFQEKNPGLSRSRVNPVYIASDVTVSGIWQECSNVTRKGRNIRACDSDSDSMAL